MDNSLLTLETQLTQHTARQFRHALQAVIEVKVSQKKLQQRMLLCLSEALANLFEHAQATVISVQLTFEKRAEGWALILSDNSEPWDPTAHLQDDLLTEFSDKEGGRGVALMHAQSDAIDYFSGGVHAFNRLTLQWLNPVVKQRRTILLVEDNEALRRLYDLYLSHDYTVVSAYNGYDALEKLQQQPVHLVLSDIKMPQMNGLSLRKKINQQPGCDLIPFIFLTGEDNELVQSQASDLGIDDYLLKPITKTQLLKTIQRVVGRSTQIYQQLTDRLDKKISASLKPNLPEQINGWRLQVASRDTGAGGGDLLLHKSCHQYVNLLVTDIMGHDDSAKFFAHAYGGYLHGLMQTIPNSAAPGQLLEQLSNGAMSDQLLSQITLTCCAVQLAENGRLRLASAGHPAPLLISEKQIRPLHSGGALLGLIENAQYPSTDITLLPGQRIALFTDGLFESGASNIERQCLQNKITTALLNTLHLPIAQALRQVMALFDQLTAEKPNDDALLLLIEPI